MRIPCAIYRAGTSKPVLFTEDQLPGDARLRDQIVLEAFGASDVRQIDGLGGGDPRTSKVAYIGPSTVPDADVNYTFGYVGIGAPLIDYRGNCGNTSAAVGPFAVLRGLIRPVGPITCVRIYNTNTKKVIRAQFELRDDTPLHTASPVRTGEPSQAPAGPSSGTKVVLDFAGCHGSVTGRLLPTGRVRDKVRFPTLGVLEVSLVDAANPFAFVRAEDLGLRGSENGDGFVRHGALQKCEEIRATVADLLGIASYAEATHVSPGVPKVAVVAGPATYETVNGCVQASQVDVVARMTALQRPHSAFGATGAVCLAAAAQVDGTIVN
ncbi:MAG: PrpF domain-containing protein, partial [Gemmatimonas sp.]